MRRDLYVQSNDGTYSPERNTIDWRYPSLSGTSLRGVRRSDTRPFVGVLVGSALGACAWGALILLGYWL
jgi:hypothetical protein